MFTNTVLNLALIFVPCFFYSLILVLAFSTLARVFPNLYYRQFVNWPVQEDFILSWKASPIPPFSAPYEDKFTGSAFCKEGQIVDSSFGTAYLPVDQVSKGVDIQNSTFINHVADRFDKLVLDCPQIGYMSWDPGLSVQLNMHLRTLELFSWTLSFNKRHPDKHLNVWFRLPQKHNNSFNFDSYFCMKLALEGNRISPNSVQGFVINSEPALDIDAPIFSDGIAFWRKFVGQFGFQLGLAISWNTCIVPDFPRIARLGLFDEVFYDELSGNGFASTETGITAFVKRRFKVCEVKLVMQTVNRLKIMLRKITLYPIWYNSGPMCLWYRFL